MRGCRVCRGLIPEAIYGDLEAGSREKLDRHLARCPECACLFADLAATVRKFDVRTAPAAPPEFWERLEKRMAAEAPRPSRAVLVPRWACGLAGAVVILALGIFIGRELTRRTAQPVVATRAVSQGAAPVTLRAAHYLKRSRVLILAVVNADLATEDPFGLNLPLQKKTSEALMIEAAALKKELGGTDRRLERLLSDLEMILLQIANLKPDPDSADIDVIRAGVESRDILFKIQLDEARRSTNKSGAGLAPVPRGGDLARATV
ncbi:MAG TPA: zf-HC2 domain-containing protein [Acidobacteriota bacterium]|nr:zf-HC2 domain-containing protein [Acidobacteriota bacterium]